MMTNKHNNVIYTGVTNDLMRRVSEHKEKKFKGFTKQYNLDRLVYYEEFYEIDQAIAHEKQIKGGSRKKKDLLVAKINPEWRDLSLVFCN
jgi:putative endonuclease